MVVKDISEKMTEDTNFAIFHYSDKKMEQPLFCSDYGKYKDYKELEQCQVENIGLYDWASGQGVAIFI